MTLRANAAAVALMVIITQVGPAFAAEIPYEAWFPGTSSILEPEVIPPAYRGRWAPTAKDCADKDGVTRLTIYPRGVDYYESGGRLRRITQAGQPRSVKLRLEYEGEGELWDQEEVWTLSSDGRQLQITPSRKASLRLVSCG